MRSASRCTRDPVHVPRNLKSTSEREFLIDNLLVRIHFIIEMIRWTGLAPWEFELFFPGSLTSKFGGHLDGANREADTRAEPEDHHRRDVWERTL